MTEKIHYYSDKKQFYMAVDCIIFGFRQGTLSILLQKRTFAPEIGRWSLMGGFLNEHESLDQASARVLCELTGLDSVYLEQVHTYSDPLREPMERVLSTAYYALIDIDESNMVAIERHNASWVEMSALPDLLFDHRRMIDDALSILRRKASTEPIGFNLLPSLFTLTQLQLLYEAISGQALDKRNFRKRVQDMDFLQKTDSIDRSSSKRGAVLYRFNDKRYRKIGGFRL